MSFPFLIDDDDAVSLKSFRTQWLHHRLSLEHFSSFLWTFSVEVFHTDFKAEWRRQCNVDSLLIIVRPLMVRGVWTCAFSFSCLFYSTMMSRTMFTTHWFNQATNWWFYLSEWIWSNNFFFGKEDEDFIVLHHRTHWFSSLSFFFSFVDLDQTSLSKFFFIGLSAVPTEHSDQLRKSSFLIHSYWLSCIWMFTSIVDIWIDRLLSSSFSDEEKKFD